MNNIYGPLRNKNNMASNGGTYEDCMSFAFAAGKALTDDPCQSSPCQNGGVCIQVRYGRFRCECTGTGFYGDSCGKGKTDKLFGIALSFKLSLILTVTN